MSNILLEYFDWLYNKVCNDKYGNNSYKKLFEELFYTTFTPLMERDFNRYSDGLNLRYYFGDDVGYSEDTIDRYLSAYIPECNILEMMIALASDIENQMSDVDYGDRTGQWFWNMIFSLGLGNMSDNNYNELFTKNVIKKFLNRDYEPNGKGGLFTLYNTNRDLRKVEIWYQAMWYLDENFDFSI